MAELGYINYEQYNLDIKVTSNYIFIAKIQIMTTITFDTGKTTKRKVANLIEEIKITQNDPNKRIRNDGSQYESKIIRKFNQSGLKPIRTTVPDRGIDVIGEYN